MKAEIKIMDAPPSIAKKGRTLQLVKTKVADPVKWVKWLEENCLASAGPNPSIVGLRNLYWGKTSLIVRAGKWVYCLAYEDKGQSMPWE